MICENDVFMWCLTTPSFDDVRKDAQRQARGRAANTKSTEL